jgi:hypothetical protein
MCLMWGTSVHSAEVCLADVASKYQCPAFSFLAAALSPARSAPSRNQEGGPFFRLNPPFLHSSIPSSARLSHTTARASTACVEGATASGHASVAMDGLGERRREATHTHSRPFSISPRTTQLFEL